MTVRPDRVSRVAASWGGLVVAATAAAARLPVLSMGRLRTFDDGVYGLSVLAMREGAVPFRDVFSSQGPLFLPVLWLADVVGLRRPWAPRLAMVASGMVLAIALWRLASRRSAPVPAMLVGVAVAVGGSVFLASGPLQSEGPTMALATAAFVVADRDDPRWWRVFVAGVLVGLAGSTKNVFAVPAAVAVAATVWRRRSATATIVVAGCAAATAVAVALPFGVGVVWDQSVRFHLEGRGVPDVAGHVGELMGGLVRYEPALVGLAVAAVAAAVVRRPARRADLTVAVAWLAVSVGLVVVLGAGSGRERYLVAVVPPVVLLMVALGPSARLVAVVLALLAPVQLAVSWGLVWGRHPNETQARLVAFLEELPAGSSALTDVPDLAYAAGRRAPPGVVDTSFAVVEAGRLTAADLAEVLVDPEVCAVVLGSGRLARVEGLDDVLTDVGMMPGEVFDGVWIARRPSCGER